MKRYEQKVKNCHRRKSPQGGWRIGSKEPIRKDLFFLLAAIYNISKLKLMHSGPCYLGSKGLQQACNTLELKHSGGRSFREALIHPRVGNLYRIFFSFLLDLLKNNEQSKSNVPKHTLKVFWVTTLVTKKKLSKNLLSWGNLILQKKGSKESKISLGS